MTTLAVEAGGLRHSFPGPRGPVPVLVGLDLTVAAGEHVAVVGRSGSGKSTLLSLLGGLERPQGGDLTVLGRDLSTIGA